MSREVLAVRIREATSEDMNFVFSSWLKSYKPSFFSKMVEPTIYFENHHKILEKIFKTAKIKIACAKDDISQIYGYVCSDIVQGVKVIHYVYVKHTFRKLGIAKALVKDAGHDSKVVSCTTHLTRIAEIPCAKHNILYHPYLLIDNEQFKAEPKVTEQDVAAVLVGELPNE